MNHATEKRKLKEKLEKSLMVNEVRLDLAKIRHEEDPSNDSKRFLVGELKSKINCIKKELWQFEIK